MSTRLNDRLAKLKEEGRAGFVPFIMAGDRSVEMTGQLLAQLPEYGADIIELGMPFSDPMADGTVIQAAGQRALAGGMNIHAIFEQVEMFRKTDNQTPIVLMGYANPVYRYGVAAFMQDAAYCGIDGVIIVDVPPEEYDLLDESATANGISVVRLIAPPSLETRLPTIAQHATGFLYYITIKGITGTGKGDYAALGGVMEQIRQHSELPIAAGFGISSAEDVAAVAEHTDLVVVGSALVKLVAEMEGQEDEAIVQAILTKCRELSAGITR
ncbi:MAG: tryptophan synthase subunit alpha [Rickettsiales bacterium]|nr:tryptophan synthase subunit alpha [Rickettsiales bacterium]|tara:strand:- start:1126 stop:1935 length:810 start_codon:yes stop_codon:yes gene_type:complete